MKLQFHGGKLLTKSGKLCTTCCPPPQWYCWSWRQAWVWSCEGSTHKWVADGAATKEAFTPCETPPTGGANGDCGWVTYGTPAATQDLLPETSDAPTPTDPADDELCCGTPPPGYGYWTVSFFWDIGACSAGTWSRTPGWAVTEGEGLRFIPDAAADAGWNYSPDGLSCVHNGASVPNGTAADIGEDLPSETPSSPPQQTVWWYILRCAWQGQGDTCDEARSNAVPVAITNYVIQEAAAGANLDVPENTDSCSDGSTTDNDVTTYFKIVDIMQYQGGWVGPYCTEAEVNAMVAEAIETFACGMPS